MSTEESRQESPPPQISEKAIRTIKSVKAKETLAADYISRDHPEYQAAGYRILYDLQRLSSKNRRVRKILKDKGFTYFPGYPKEFFKRPSCGALSSNQELVALGSDTTIQIVNLASEVKNILHTFSFDQVVKEIRWVGDQILVLSGTELYRLNLITMFVEKLDTQKAIESISPSGRLLLVRDCHRDDETSLQIGQLLPADDLKIRISHNLSGIRVDDKTSLAVKWSDSEEFFGIQMIGWYSESGEFWIFDTQQGDSIQRFTDIPKNIRFIMGDGEYLKYDIGSLKLSILSVQGAPKKVLDLSNNGLTSRFENAEILTGIKSLIPNEQEPIIPMFFDSQQITLMGGQSMLIYQLSLEDDSVDIIQPFNHAVNQGYPTDFPSLFKLSPGMWIVARPLATQKKRSPEWWEYGNQGYEDDQYYAAQREYEADQQHPPNELLSILDVSDGWTYTDLKALAIITEHEPQVLCSCFTSNGNRIASIVKITERSEEFAEWIHSYEVKFFDIETGTEKGKPWPILDGKSRFEGMWDVYDIIDIAYSWDNRYLAIAGVFIWGDEYTSDTISAGVIILDLKEKVEIVRILDTLESLKLGIDKINPNYLELYGVYPFLGIKWIQDELHLALPEYTFVIQGPDFEYKGAIPNPMKKRSSDWFLWNEERFSRTQNKYFDSERDILIDSELSNHEQQINVRISSPGDKLQSYSLEIDTHLGLEESIDDFFETPILGIKVEPKKGCLVAFFRNRLDSYNFDSGGRDQRVKWRENIRDILIHPSGAFAVIITRKCIDIVTIPNFKKIYQFQAPPFLLESPISEFLRWGNNGNYLVAFGKGIWAIDVRKALNNLILSPHFDRS